MKTTVSIFIILLISIQSFSQINQDKALYAYKVTKYTKMKQTGTILAVAGGILTITGIIVLSNSSYVTVEDGNGNIQEYTEGNPELGALCFLAGSAGLGAGIPLAIVGSRSKRKYEAKLKTVSLKINANPNKTGLALTYRF